MSNEYMVKIKISINQTVAIGINGKVKGVYSDNGAIKVDWDFNGVVQQLVSGVTVWEPNIAFEPAKTSKLQITSTAGCNVLVRME